MSCNFPQPLVVEGEEIVVSCGRCEACRYSRAREWGARCLAESMLHEESSVHTMTYAVSPGSLRYRDVQLLLKRLRKRGRFRYFVSGEYGDRFGRPHYHLLAFGSSPDVASAWSHGDVRSERLSAAACFYAARYAAKKLGRSERPNFCVDEETGEVVPRVPEFSRMSLKPAIGAGFVARFSDELFANGSLVLEGRRYALPRVFKDRLAGVDPLRAEEMLWRLYSARGPRVSAERGEAVELSMRKRREFFVSA